MVSPVLYLDTCTPIAAAHTAAPVTAPAPIAAAAAAATTPRASAAGTTVDLSAALSSQQTKLRAWLENRAVDSEQLKNHALDECTTKPICQMFLKEVFTMALKTGIDDAEVSGNLERASTVIKDLYVEHATRNT